MEPLCSTQNLAADDVDNECRMETVEKLLKSNHDKYHVFFNHPELFYGIPLHNHLPHHVLTLYALGASSETMQKHFAKHESYQRRRPAEYPGLVAKMDDYSVFRRCLGQEHHYTNFLQHFTTEMDKVGYEKAVLQLVFAETDIATEILSRQFMGFIHPLIHTGFGLEFDQPHLVLEGLAMGCVQDDVDIRDILLEAEIRCSTQEGTRSLVELLEIVSADADLIQAAYPDMFHLLDNESFLGQHRATVIEYASMFVVAEADVVLRAAEICNATSYMLAGAQRHDKAMRMDFFIMHLTNASVLLDAIVHKGWIASRAKARFLSWFGRFCILLYLAVGSPRLDLTPIRKLKLLRGSSSWIDAISKGIEYADDGHGCKMIRALAHAENASQPYEHRPEFRMTGTDFEKAAIAVAESFLPPNVVQRAGPDQTEAWIRMAGFDSAWEGVPSQEPSGK